MQINKLYIIAVRFSMPYSELNNKGFPCSRLYGVLDHDSDAN
jgi:hypothetical protein